MENLIQTILPTICVSCGRLGAPFCYRCAYSCSVVSEGVCIKCKRPSIDGMTHVKCADTFSPMQLFSCFGYVGEVKKCLRKVWNPPHEFAALKALSSYGVSFAMQVGYYLFDYIVVPMPLTSETKGFNENHFVAKEIASNLGLFVNSNGLRVAGNFPVFPFFADLKRVCNKKLLLVDTVCRTGKTLLVASKALYAAGVVEVRCFTLARVI